MEREAIRNLNEDVIRLDQSVKNQFRRIENLENQILELKNKRIYIRRVKHRPLPPKNIEIFFWVSRLVEWIATNTEKKTILLYLILFLLIIWLFCRTYSW
jgi:hypothetical protein